VRIAIYPGTFDPITFGHLDIISRAMQVVDKLVIGVALDSGKEPIFSIDERADLVRAEVAKLGDIAKRIEVRTFAGLLANFAREQKATILLRGLRAVSDFEYEFQMASVNNKIAPEIETVFLTASDSTHYISSRFVKQIAKLGGDVSKMVPPDIAEALAQHYLFHK
jgi:pantetheine-phosphate adenylyltransferase